MQPTMTTLRAVGGPNHSRISLMVVVSRTIGPAFAGVTSSPRCACAPVVMATEAATSATITAMRVPLMCPPRLIALSMNRLHPSPKGCKEPAPLAMDVPRGS